MTRQWEEFKSRALSKLSYAREHNLADEKIFYLLDYINSKEGYVTTSSCSGRILLLAKGPSKKETYMYKKWHDKATTNSVVGAINSYDGPYPLYYKVDPFILHIVAKTPEHAHVILRICKNAGLKRFGMQLMRNFYLIEIQGTDKLEFPIALCNCNMDEVVELSNSLLERTWSRTKLFYLSAQETLK